MDSIEAGELRERLSRLWMHAEPAVNAYVFAAVQRFQDAEDVVQVMLFRIRDLLAECVKAELAKEAT